MHDEFITLPFDNLRFWTKVDFRGPIPAHRPELGRCWVWEAGRDEGGYGRFANSLGSPLAHRYAYERTNGPVADGLDVCHECDNRACVRPSHLFSGTHRDNMRDRDSKGRCHTAGPHGTANGSTKLSESDVRAIRRRYAEGDISLRALSTVYGVSYTAMYAVIKRKTWQFVGEEADASPEAL